MLPTMIAVSTTFIMVGFIFLADIEPGNPWAIFIKLIITLGMITLIGCLFMSRSQEHKEQVHEQAFLIYLIAIAKKLGVEINDITQARKEIDVINDISWGKYKSRKRSKSK